MKKSHKIILLILTLLPIVLFIPIVIQNFYFIMEMVDMGANPDPDVDPESVMKFVIGMFVWVGLISIVSIGLLVYYIVHALNNKALESNERIVWILLFVFVSGISHMIYFFMRVWPLSEPEQVSLN